MKYTQRLYIFGLLLSQITASIFTQNVDSLEQKLNRQYAQMRSVISVGNESLIAQIQEIQTKLRRLEEVNGISDLQLQISVLRNESCRLQIQDPELSKIRKEQDQIVRNLESATKDEREKIEQLIQKTGMKQEDAATRKNNTKALDKIQEKLEKKALPYKKQLEVLNKKMYNHPQIKALFEKVRPIAQAMDKKYDAIKTEIDQYNKQLSDLIKQVNNKLKSKDSELKNMREAIFKTREEIYKQDPCFATRRDMESSSEDEWIELFA